MLIPPEKKNCFLPLIKCQYPPNFFKSRLCLLFHVILNSHVLHLNQIILFFKLLKHSWLIPTLACAFFPGTDFVPSHLPFQKVPTVKYIS